MNWEHWNSIEYDPHEMGDIAKGICSELVAAILWSRGLRTSEAMRAFLSADLDCLHDPMLLADMQKGVTRIRQAIETGERVAIYGDYDADGITAAALVSDYLRDKGLFCHVHIPDRLEAGYGITPEALAALADESITLIITVDCGITAVSETAYAKTLGIDIVITDHHQCQGDLPDAAAVIDPMRVDCPYPNKALSGVGVAFQCMLAVEGVEHREVMLDRYGDLVAIGTVADVMELTGENRALVVRGIVSIRTGGQIGLRALIRVAILRGAGMEQETISAQRIGYELAPRINAAGRMGCADLALSLLTAKNSTEARKFAVKLDELNKTRREIGQDMLIDAIEQLEAEHYQSGPIILASDSWHKGIVGVVAAKLMEQYRAPTILISMDGDSGRGSCRGIPGFDLFSALSACAEHLEAFGGHEQAAGISVSAKKLNEFKAAFQAYYAENPPSASAATLHADLTIDTPHLLTLAEVESLDTLQPCGKGNPYPVLVIEGATLHSITPIGGGKHLKLDIKKWGKLFNCIYFATTAKDLDAKKGDLIDIAFIPQCNTFRNKTSVQLNIRDFAKTHRRQINKAKHLCAAIAPDTANGRFPPLHDAMMRSYANRLCPDRADFIPIWRQLSRTGEPIVGDLEQVLQTLVNTGKKQNHGKLYLCLKIMDEVGLISFKEKENVALITLHTPAEKVDLDTSPMLIALQSLQCKAKEGASQ